MAWLRWDLWYFRDEVWGSCGIMKGDVASLRLVDGVSCVCSFIRPGLEI